MKELTISYETVGLWDENTYLIQGEQSSILVDPGDEFERLDHSFFDGNGEDKIKFILCTHGHFDHIGAALDFQKKYNLSLAIHAKDKRLVSQANLYRQLAGDKTVVGTPKIDFFLEDKNEVKLEGNSISIHYLPGHSKGSVAFEFGTNLISGDILLPGELGRTDLPGGNKDSLIDSVNYILKNFEGYNIYPGHGAPFLLDKEKIDFYQSLIV